MANIYSLKSGLASDVTVWSGGAVPVQGDRVLICAGHTVTLDGVYTWGDDSTATLTVNAVSTTSSITVAGTLFHSRSVSSELICYGSIYLLNGGDHDSGKESDPILLPATAKVTLNKSAVMAANKYFWIARDGAKFSFWGQSKKIFTQLSATAAAAATSIQVDDATGWQAGDKLILSSSDTTADNRQDYAVIAAGYVSGDLTVPLVAGLSFAHAAVVCYVGNYTSTVTVGNFNDTYPGLFRAESGSVGGSLIREVGDMLFSQLGYLYPDYGPRFVMSANYASTFYNQPYKPFKRVVVDEGSINQGNALMVENFSTENSVEWDDCLVFSRYTGAAYGIVQVNNKFTFKNSVTIGIQVQHGGTTNSLIENVVALPRRYTGGVLAFSYGAHGAVIRNCKTGGRQSNGSGFVIYYGAQYHTSDVLFDNCDFGVSIPISGTAPLFTFQSLMTRTQVTLLDCVFAAGVGNPPAVNYSNMTQESYIKVVNKNKDVTAQEWHVRSGRLVRDNVEAWRGVSSISAQPVSLNTPLTKAISLPCSNGQTIRIVGYVKANTAFYNGGGASWNPPTVALSGLGATPVVFTASSAANNAWEQYDISITNTAGYDGNFTLTYTANAKSVTTGAVYFDGVPDAPFVTKCRHYGFDLTQETSPTRTVDPYVVATEATAAGYTGIAIDGTAKTITFSAGTGDTAQKFYDYSRSWACLNLAKDIPLNRAGALFSLASGWTVIEPTYAGMTWGGGKVRFTTPGAKSGGFDSNMWDFTATGNYDFANATIGGTIELINTSGGAVAVSLPAGASYTNTGPSITVTVAVDQAEASITGIVPGSRLQIRNMTVAAASPLDPMAGEMVNAINATSSYALSYPTGTGYSAGDVVRVRLTYCAGLDAKLPAEYFTVAAAGGWAVLAGQVTDDVYVANGIDGSTVTEYSSDYVNVQIDVSDVDGYTTIQRGYAWCCDQMTWADGIRYFFGAFKAEDNLNYLLNTDVANIKLQNAGVTPVTVAEGAVRRKDGTSPIADGGSIYMYYGRAYSVETGVSGLTSAESNKLMGLPDLATLEAAVIPVDVAKIHGDAVIGSGTTNDPWRNANTAKRPYVKS